ncbi:MAG: Mur ligase family protein [Patescibacteria group bacterium]
MKKAYFIGIAGAGMSAVAKLLKDKGWEVSGSDEGCYPPVSDYLDKQNISYKIGYTKNNLPENLDLIVIGMNAKLRPDINEEVKFALESEVQTKTFPEVLAELSQETENIVVVGSYAKSTCTAMLTHCLENAGKDPSYFIGAIPVDESDTSKLGKENIFVMEGDEYPANREENKSKFLYLRPDNLLLTSAEHDHVNIFPTIEEYLKPFQELMKKTPVDGLLIACLDNPNVDFLIKKSNSKVVTYGLEKDKKPIWLAENIKYGKISSFDILKNGEKIISLETSLLGKHNIQNILGVTTLLLEKDLITSEQLKEGIESFRGIKRRLELKTKNSEVPVYEGFGSSYDKARAAIEALKIHFPKKNLKIIFEPHTFSWRNREKIYWYDDVFEDCQKVFVFTPPTQGADTHSQLSLGEIVNRIKESGVNTETISVNDWKNKLEMSVTDKDIVLMLSSGSFEGTLDNIINFIETKFNERI